MATVFDRYGRRVEIEPKKPDLVGKKVPELAEPAAAPKKRTTRKPRATTKKKAAAK